MHGVSRALRCDPLLRGLSGLVPKNTYLGSKFERLWLSFPSCLAVFVKVVVRGCSSFGREPSAGGDAEALLWPSFPLTVFWTSTGDGCMSLLEARASNLQHIEKQNMVKWTK